MIVAARYAGKCRRRQACRLDIDTEFLVQLADQRRLRSFARLDLATRKLPQSCVIFIRWTLLDQHAPLAIDERRGNNRNRSHRVADNLLTVTNLSTCIPALPDAVPMLSFVSRLRSCPKAATAVEYALIVSLIVISMLGGFVMMAGTTVDLWGGIGNRVAPAR